MMVVVHQTSYNIGLLWVQLLQDVGRVWGQVHQLLLSYNFTVVLCFKADVLHKIAAQTYSYASLPYCWTRQQLVTTAKCKVADIIIQKKIVTGPMMVELAVKQADMVH